MRRRPIVLTVAALGILLVLSGIYVLTLDFGSCPAQVNPGVFPCYHTFPGTNIYITPTGESISMVGLLVALSSLFLGLHWRNSPLPKNEGMKRISMVITIIVAVGLLVFFLAPVSLWFNSGSPIAGETMSVPVYRSLGCAMVGFGDLYAPSWFGFSFGCNIPVPLPF